ncbi:hypothetical protein ACQP25_44590 (plasmid) [Microtetraspora malaysiensis]|uniref:hypothetical protein n=1 Tax=Microtetraspora malaysiensis TaxID=161358 RepID=UPI003D8DADEA
MVTARELVEHFNIAAARTATAHTLADASAGQPDAYPALAELVASARDAYGMWAEVAGAEVVAEEVRELGRIMLGYLATLEDSDVYDLADTVMEHARHVSVRAVQWVLNVAYPDNHPSKVHTRDIAAKRHAEQCESPEAVEIATVGILLTIVGMPNRAPGTPDNAIDIIATLQRQAKILTDARRAAEMRGEHPPAPGTPAFVPWARQTLAEWEQDTARLMRVRDCLARY